MDLDNPSVPSLPTDRPILVYSDDHLIYKYLTWEPFKCTDNRDEADIIWENTHMRDFK